MSPGKVFLVGAGPGDPGLLTVKGLRCLQSADVVMYDRLVDRRSLSNARADAEMMDVGKVPGDRGRRQAEINALLIDRARQGKTVVRLQGGDPFVFGRGGEEAEELRRAGVPFEIVPGVTSAIAAPAYAGIPLTQRGVSSSFTVVTGSEAPDKPESSVDWAALARKPGTLVVLMGWESLPAIAEALVHHGMSPDTPVALVMWGTEPWQRTVTGVLTDIVDRARAADLSSPIVAVIGQVVDLREKLRWYDNLPLFGKRVLVTRTRTQASQMSQALEESGALPVEVPTIEIQRLQDYTELDGELRALAGYGWVVFSSTNSVDVVFERLAADGRDARALAGVRVACIGEATSDRLRTNGIAPDLMPGSYVSESMVEAFNGVDVAGQRVLVPGAEEGRDTLAKGLSERGAHVYRVAAYRTVMPEESRRLAESAISEGVDIATFTSSSTVLNLSRLLDGDLSGLSDATVACIGPVTTATAGELGLHVDIVAQDHTIVGLVSALVTALGDKLSQEAIQR